MEASKTFEEFLRTLYLAREFLTSQKGQHRDPEAADYIIHTWTGYCEEIGIPYQTANNWLNIIDAALRGKPHRSLTMPAGFAAAVWWLTKGKKAQEDFSTKSRERAGRIISEGLAAQAGRAG